MKFTQFRLTSNLLSIGGTARELKTITNVNSDIGEDASASPEGILFTFHYYGNTSQDNRFKTILIPWTRVQYALVAYGATQTLAESPETLTEKPVAQSKTSLPTFTSYSKAKRKSK